MIFLRWFLYMIFTVKSADLQSLNESLQDLLDGIHVSISDFFADRFCCSLLRSLFIFEFMELLLHFKS